MKALVTPLAEKYVPCERGAGGGGGEEGLGEEVEVEEVELGFEEG